MCTSYYVATFSRVCATHTMAALLASAKIPRWRDDRAVSFMRSFILLLWLHSFTYPPTPPSSCSLNNSANHQFLPHQPHFLGLHVEAPASNIQVPVASSVEESSLLQNLFCLPLWSPPPSLHLQSNFDSLLSPPSAAADDHLLVAGPRSVSASRQEGGVKLLDLADELCAVEHSSRWGRVPCPEFPPTTESRRSGMQRRVNGCVHGRSRGVDR